MGCPQQSLGHSLIVAQRKEQAAPLLHRGRLSHCSCISRTISATAAQTAAAQTAAAQTAAAQVSVGRDSTGVIHRQTTFTGSPIGKYTVSSSSLLPEVRVTACDRVSRVVAGGVQCATTPPAQRSAGAGLPAFKAQGSAAAVLSACSPAAAVLPACAAARGQKPMSETAEHFVQRARGPSPCHAALPVLLLMLMQLPAQLHLGHAPNQRQPTACGAQHRGQHLCCMAATCAAANTGRQLSPTQKDAVRRKLPSPVTTSLAPLDAEYMQPGLDRLCTKQGACTLCCPAAHPLIVQPHGPHKPHRQGRQVQAGPLQAPRHYQQQCPAAGQGPAAVAAAVAAAPCRRHVLLRGQQAAWPHWQPCPPRSLPWAASPGCH